MKKKIFSVLIIVVIVLVVGSIFGPTVINKIGKDNVITSAQFEKAIDICQFSTVEFVYNGVVEKYDDDKPKEVEC